MVIETTSQNLRMTITQLKSMTTIKALIMGSFNQGVILRLNNSNIPGNNIFLSVDLMSPAV